MHIYVSFINVHVVVFVVCLVVTHSYHPFAAILLLHEFTIAALVSAFIHIQCMLGSNMYSHVHI